MEPIDNVLGMAKQYAKEIKQDGHDNSAKWLLEDIEKVRAELARLQCVEQAARVVLSKYANPNNWRSVNGVMVYETLSHPWGDAAEAMRIIDRKDRDNEQA
jgi:hypothetical protein